MATASAKAEEPVTYPVVAEIWSLFEASLNTQARRLVEDIAKHQGADPKELLKLIRAQTRISLFDPEFPEPALCTFQTDTVGAIHKRCRIPCVLGFGACSLHIHMRKATEAKATEAKATAEVDTVKDHTGAQFFVDSKNIARDINGKPKGIVEDGVLFLFTQETSK